MRKINIRIWQVNPASLSTPNSVLKFNRTNMSHIWAPWWISDALGELWWINELVWIRWSRITVPDSRISSVSAGTLKTSRPAPAALADLRRTSAARDKQRQLSGGKHRENSDTVSSRTREYRTNWRLRRVREAWGALWYGFRVRTFKGTAGGIRRVYRALLSTFLHTNTTAFTIRLPQQVFLSEITMLVLHSGSWPCWKLRKNGNEVTLRNTWKIFCDCSSIPFRTPKATEKRGFRNSSTGYELRHWCRWALVHF